MYLTAFCPNYVTTYCSEQQPRTQDIHGQIEFRHQPSIIMSLDYIIIIFRDVLTALKRQTVRFYLYLKGLQLLM